MWWPTVYDGYELEIQIVDHCNLNCSNCNHFTPLADKYFISLEEFRNQLLLVKKTLPSIKMLMLLGGEPFLHPQLIELCQIAREIFPDISLNILTNGIILSADYSEEKLEQLKKLNVLTSISQYPAQNYKQFPEGDQFSYLNNRFFFCQTRVNLQGTEDPNTRPYGCPNRIPCFTLKDYKIFFCQFGAHIDFFCKRFHKQIPLIENKDFIRLTEETTLDDLQHLKDTVHNICRYHGKEEMINWNPSSRAIEEYTQSKKELFLYNYKKYYKDFIDYSYFIDFSNKKYWERVDEYYSEPEMRCYRARNEGKIDIIIPVYKFEKNSLKKCIDSIINQTIIDDCVIYLISNNSPLESELFDIYNNYWPNYNILLLKTKKDEQGPAFARTTGIKNSYNKYFFCLDADDELYDSLSLESLYDFAETNNFGVIQGQTITYNNYDNGNIIIKDAQADGHSLLYNRKFFEEQHFNYGKFIFNEDRYMLLQIYNYYNCKVPTLDKIVYKYNQNSGTSMGKDITNVYSYFNDIFVITYYYLNNKLSPDMFQHIFNQILYRIQVLDDNNENDNDYYDIKLGIISCLLLINNNQLFQQLPNEYKSIINKINNNENIQLKNIFIWNKKSLFNRFKYFLFNNNSCKIYLDDEYKKNIIQKEEELYVS